MEENILSSFGRLFFIQNLAGGKIAQSVGRTEVESMVFIFANTSTHKTGHWDIVPIIVIVDVLSVF